MIDVLIVDGYNILNGWPELAKLSEESLEHGRDKLIEILANWRGLCGNQVIVVFDAHLVRGGVQTSEVVDGIQVIYTPEGVTADQAIEKMVQKIPDGLSVYVATSDYIEQRLIFGKGAYRLPARELRKLVYSTLQDNRRQITLNRPGPTLDARLPAELRRVLEEWRRQKS
ncbi:MAG: NYN domain-containing protein [Firmicutes bacterium]|nr:NYN domain-containing protein [Bacillota bacterium]